MTKFESFKSKNIDELVEWLYKYREFDGSPWMEWWDKNYCKNCESKIAYNPYAKRNAEYAYCELHGNCKFFKDVEDVLDDKQIIKMWLESEADDKPLKDYQIVRMLRE